MTEEEARSIMKAYGWGWLVRRRRHSICYIYAIRREQHKVKDRYIGPLSRLSELTEAELISKLTRTH